MPILSNASNTDARGGTFNDIGPGVQINVHNYNPINLDHAQRQTYHLNYPDPGSAHLGHEEDSQGVPPDFRHQERSLRASRSMKDDELRWERPAKDPSTMPPCQWSSYGVQEYPRPFTGTQGG